MSCGDRIRGSELCPELALLDLPRGVACCRARGWPLVPGGVAHRAGGRWHGHRLAPPHAAGPRGPGARTVHAMDGGPVRPDLGARVSVPGALHLRIRRHGRPDNAANFLGTSRWLLCPCRAVHAGPLQSQRLRLLLFGRRDQRPVFYPAAGTVRARDDGVAAVLAPVRAADRRGPHADGTAVHLASVHVL